MGRGIAALAFVPGMPSRVPRGPRWRTVAAPRLFVARLLGIGCLWLGPPPSAAAASSVGAATSDSSGRLRLSQVLQDGKDGVEGLFGALSATVSPDGANVYVTGWYGDSLAVFARDAQSGQLTFLEALRNGVNGTDGLGNPNAVTVSPDGAHVYVLSDVSRAVTAFARDPRTGRLTVVQTQRDGLPGPDPSLRGFAVSYGLAVSPDGAHVYVGGHATENDLAVFARDAATGQLTPVELVSTGLPPTDSVRVSPDGAHVYAAGGQGAVTAFQRDAATGRVTRLASWNARANVDTERGLDTNVLTLSPDGTSVYLAGYHDHSVTAFARDPGTGLLSVLQTVRSGVEGVLGLEGARGVAVSPDGAHLWAAGWADKAVVLFARDPHDGRLAFVEARRDVVPEWIGLGEVFAPVLSPDGRQLYVASVSNSALLVFSTDGGGMPPIVRCVGDCDWDSQVTIDELVKGTNIALETAGLSTCEMFDSDGSHTVAVDELLQGVNNALNGCVEPLTPGDHRRTVALGGYTRIYDVHVPPGYDGGTAVPLVLDFHGSALNQTDQAGVTGWRSRADREGFVVAYPLGLFGQSEAPEVDVNATQGLYHGPAFNAGPLCCGKAKLRRVDDVGFARAIVQGVAAEANIDRTRVYATGWSNGGFMSYRLACEAADVFAAVAPVAGRIGLFPTTSCQPSRPIAVIELAGLHDPKVGYEGSNGWPSAAESFAYWRDQNGCGSGPPDDRVDLGTSYCDTYRSCSAGVQVELCSIEASQTSYAVGHCTYLNPDIDVAATAWKFLSRFRLPAE